MEGRSYGILRLFLTLCAVSLIYHYQPAPTYGGQLDRIRSKTKKPRASRKKDDREATDPEPKSGKLDRIRENAESHHHGRPSRRAHRHPPRRPRRSPYFAPSFLSFGACYPPVIEEHVHIYRVDAVPVEPVPAPVVAPAQPFLPDVRPPEPIWEPIEPWRLQWSMEYGIPLDEVSHWGTELIIQSPSRWGIDTRFALKLEEGSHGFRDSLWNGEFNLTYEVIRTTDLRVRAGVGLNWIGDSYHGEAGPNLMVGGQWQFTTACSLDGYLAFGTVGRADMFHGRLTAGYKMTFSELYTGIDHYRVGGESISTWITGLRFRF